MKLMQLLPPDQNRCQSKSAQKQGRFGPLFVLSILIAGLTNLLLLSQPISAQTGAYCELTPEEIARKARLRQAAINGDNDDWKRYEEMIEKHAQQLQDCRSRTWPREQAIWVRLYPCDSKPGMLDVVMDRVVNRGYNQVNVEVFYDGRVLLPAKENSTPWPSVIRTPGTGDVDLLEMAIQKGRDRGLKVYAWMFTMNFGYTYAQRPDRQQVIARNGKGHSTVNKEGTQVFIDPYSNQAKQDYSRLLQAVLRRRPDGVLFDYIRYPRGTGPESVAAKVQDLWIYGDAAREALLRRALNQKGFALIQQFLSKGHISASDLAAVDRRFPNEKEPLWQGRHPAAIKAVQHQTVLQAELWQLSVAHALQGILDFLKGASGLVQQRGISSGVVFFPDANRAVGKGFDSRLQPWDRFPGSLEWHPMAYGVCGNNDCIVNQVRKVVRQAPAGTQIKPALAGVWGRSIRNRPALEQQMQAIRRATPRVNALSHFAYSWQEPHHDQQRKFCRL